MPRLFRWLLWLVIGMIAAGVGMAALVAYFALRSVPDYDATLAIEGLESPVEIIRTTENVPHILAASDHDAFVALGLAHAQDRLFQMVMLRRAAEGRLSEVMGPDTFAADDLARRLGLADVARESLDAQTPQARAALEAYAQGVNQWIAQVNKGALGRGAPEFFVFPGDITYWQPADSLAILKLFAATASGAVTNEVLAARLSLADPAHGGEVIAVPGVPPLPDYAQIMAPARIPPAGPAAPVPDRLTLLAGTLAPGLTIEGNAFAVAPQRTAMGGAILAHDPHDALTAPGLWYLARLELRSGGVIGATIPGVPAILSGRNAQLAWGMTPAGLDDADVFIEEVQPGDPTRYRGPDGWTPFESRREVIRVQGASDREITLHRTANGPVLPAADFALGAVTPQGHVAAVGWTGLVPGDRSLSALIALMGAQDRGAARAALGDVTVPAMIATLADPRGVDQITVGRLPRRDTAHATGGRLPAPGWVPANRWQGLVETTPPEVAATPGLVTATGEGPGGLRMARLTRLMGEREIHSRDSLMAAQLDVVSPAARQLLPLVGADLWFTGEPAPAGTPERQRQDALTLLAEWDGAMSEHLPEPLIYAAWMAELQHRMIRDDLGPLSDEITALYPHFIEAAFRNTNGAARWCDVVQSAPIEDCTTLARQALDAAILDLTARFGADVASWRWGDAHMARQVNPGLGRLPALGWIVNLVQPTSGGAFTVAQAGFAGRGKDSFAQVTGAGYRGIYDLGDPDSSVFVTSTGQSGHPLSRHYDDLAGLWRRGEYVTMSLDVGLARAGAVGITRLVPGG